MLSTLLLVVHSLIALALVGVILIQRSEGGGLGIGGGGGPTGLVSARGAANLLTRVTTVLATVFVVTSILLAVLAARSHDTRVIDTTLARPAAPAPGAPAPGALPGLPPAQPSAPEIPVAQ